MQIVNDILDIDSFIQYIVFLSSRFCQMNLHYHLVSNK